MPGEQVIVQTHAYAQNGIVEIELAVDGEPLTRNAPSPSGGDLVTLEQTWVATTPGMHSLQVTGYSSDGRMSNPRVVVIEVIGQQTDTQIPATQTPTQTEPSSPTITPSLTSSQTLTLTPTLTKTPLLPPTINFSADNDTLEAGDCTYLRWQVENAQTVTLNGTTVQSVDARQVCPTQTTSYTLRASGGGVEKSETITISVIIPQVKDTTGPVISSITITPNLIYDNPSCGANRAQVKAAIQDDGSGVKRVDIYYQVITGETGAMVSLKMNGNENEGYYFYLGQEELSRSLALYGGGTVRVYLIAVDKDGNTTTSKTFSFQTEACLL